MKAIKFQSRFIDKISRKVKTTTIRRDKNRQYKIGLPFEFHEWDGDKFIWVFGKSVITSVIKIEIHPFAKSVYLHDGSKLRLIPADEMDEFIKKEGFNTEVEFWKWFDCYFSGVYITWSETVHIYSKHDLKLFKDD